MNQIWMQLQLYLDLDLHNYITVDFNAVVKAVDLIGGVDVEVYPAVSLVHPHVVVLSELRMQVEVQVEVVVDQVHLPRAP